METTVWVVGQTKNYDTCLWEFQGVFTEKDLAVKACRNEVYFVGPVTLNQQTPNESTEWPGAFYPLKKSN